MSDQEPIITTLYVIVDNFCQSELEMTQETSQKEKWSVLPEYDWYDKTTFLSVRSHLMWGRLRLRNYGC
jgi:hypothetical protein